MITLNIKGEGKAYEKRGALQKFGSPEKAALSFPDLVGILGKGQDCVKYSSIGK